MAKSSDLEARQAESYVDTIKMRHRRINLESVGSQKRITIAKNYKGFKLYPITNDVTFTVDDGAGQAGPQEPEASGGTADAYNVDTASSAATDGGFRRGGYAVAGAWEKRQLNSCEGNRTLIITAATASTNVIVEVFE